MIEHSHMNTVLQWEWHFINYCWLAALGNNPSPHIFFSLKRRYQEINFRHCGGLVWSELHATCTSQTHIYLMHACEMEIQVITLSCNFQNQKPWTFILGTKFLSVTFRPVNYNFVQQTQQKIASNIWRQF